MADGGMEGSVNGADGQKKQTSTDYKYAATMVSGILAIGTGGGSLMLQGVSFNMGTAFSVVGIANSADDISGLATSDGNTAFQNIVGKEVGATIKIGISFLGSKKALLNYIDTIDDAAMSQINIISFVNDQGNTFYGAIQLNKDSENEEPK